MKRMWAALLLCGALSLTTISARAHDLDFPDQLRAINVCHTQWSTQHPGKAITDAQLVACMNAQGFRFDPDRQIKGVGSCQGKTATDHPDCYAEPPKTRASRAGWQSCGGKGSARERISDDAGVPRGLFFQGKAAAQKSQRARAPQRGTTAAAV
jgi:hypothetical protein